MTLRTSGKALGSPWRRPLRGRFEQLVVESDLLASNPLGDPSQRPLYVYSSPAVAAGEATAVACVYVLQGFSGQLDGWLARKAFEPTFIERLDAMFAEPDRECADAVVVFVDAFTALGGSQFLDSPATGRYTSYICDEIVPFVDASYPTAATRELRAVSGHSSGGYGALVLPMLRPDVFGSLIAHAPDTLFEACYMSDFSNTTRILRDHYEGSYEALLKAFTDSETFNWTLWGEPINAYAMAAAYSPDLDTPGGVLLPFDTQSGQLIPEIWERWLACDPVRMAPRHADALRSLHHIHVEAGRSDEYMLDVGAVAFSKELDKLSVTHTLELFDGGHSGTSHRFAPAIRTLLASL